MSLIVELLIRQSPLFEALFAAVPDAEATLEERHYFTEDGNDHYVLFWWVSGCEFEDFERAARSHRYTCEIEPITTVEHRRLYRLTTTPLPRSRMLFPYFRRHDITTLDNRSSSDGFWVRLRVPDRDVLKKLVAKLESLDAHPEVERFYGARSEDASVSILTDRQREVLRLAAERGYFETPSRVTLEELSADLEITSQTLSDHIRAGVRNLVEYEVCDAVEPSASGHREEAT